VEKDALLLIRDIGPEVAGSIIRFFHEPQNLAVLDKLKSTGLKLTVDTREAQSDLAGKSFVFTGTLKNLVRDEAKRLVLMKGGVVHSSISPKTDFVIAGAAAGSKLDKAITYNLTILTEEQFLEMIGS